MSEAVLETEKLDKVFKLGGREIRALSDVTLKIKKGDFISIMGPSGSGKTTLLNMLGCLDKPTHGKVILDGVNLTQLFGEHAEHVASQLYWHFPHYHGSGNVPSSAVRVGDWKLIEWLETGRVELYDLAADVSESTDRAQEMPEKAEELRQVLEDWRGQVGAVLPQPNPDWE